MGDRADLHFGAGGTENLTGDLAQGGHSLSPMTPAGFPTAGSTGVARRSGTSSRLPLSSGRVGLEADGAGTNPDAFWGHGGGPRPETRSLRCSAGRRAGDIGDEPSVGAMEAATLDRTKLCAFSEPAGRYRRARVATRFADVPTLGRPHRPFRARATPRIGKNSADDSR